MAFSTNDNNRPVQLSGFDFPRYSAPLHFDMSDAYMAENWKEATETARQIVVAAYSQMAPRPVHKKSRSILARCQANTALYKTLTLWDISGYFAQFAMDIMGSKFIQHRLEVAEKEEMDAVITELLDNFDSLINHNYGNYAVQRFFELGMDKHVDWLVETLCSNIVRYTCQSPSSRVVQMAAGVVSERQRMAIVKELQKEHKRLLTDVNGNHVVQKVMEIDASYRQSVVDYLLNTPDELFNNSKDRYGCRVVQRCLELCTPVQKRPIHDMVAERVCELMGHDNGNYIVQYAVGSKQFRAKMMESLSKDLLKLSCQKYSSNIIEKCMMFGCPQQRNKLIEIACKDQKKSAPILIGMMIDKIGNYVAQKICVAATAHQSRLMAATIRAHIRELEADPQGKESLVRMEKHLRKHSKITTQK